MGNGTVVGIVARGRYKPDCSLMSDGKRVLGVSPQIISL